jgi:predicted dienelactone hydrolase
LRNSAPGYIVIGILVGRFPMERLVLAAVAVLAWSTSCESTGFNTLDAASPDATGIDVAALDATADVALPACAPYEGRGPWATGVRTIELPDRLVEVWYPAPASSVAGLATDSYDVRDFLPEADRDRIPASSPTTVAMNAYRDAPPAEGPFPLVLFSHGIASFRMQSSEMASHMASWGFVVAAPDHFERGLAAFIDGSFAFEFGEDTLRATRDLMLGKNEQTDSPFHDRIDTDRIAVAGHSLGGVAALKNLEDSNVRAAITFASGSPAQAQVTVTKPLFLVGGTKDDISDSKKYSDVFEALSLPLGGFVSISGAGHLAFSDLCPVGRDEGGIVQMAVDAGMDVPEPLVQLGSDGCTPEELPAEEAWPIIDHVTVAFLRYALGLDPEPVGLDATSIECFGDRIDDWDFTSGLD